MANLVNAENISLGFGTRILLDGVSLGLNRGDVIGVVGRNGDGKSTLLRILTDRLEPDAGRVTIANAASIGVLEQSEGSDDGSVRDLIVGGASDHVWAADASRRRVVTELLGDVSLDAPLAQLSGGERRRAALVSLILGHHDLLVLDEPTNHLDVEAVAYLAEHLAARAAAGLAMLVVSHDRWFLDAVCNRVWEVHDAQVDAYDGGYAAYVLARAERGRQAAASEQRRRNLVRKELAWLRRGAPARTSKPKFRIDAANVLIEDEPPPRDRLALAQFATARLGKDVVDLTRVHVGLPDGRELLRDVTWSIGPGDRIGLVGVNGSGKSTLLNVIAGLRRPDRGKVKHGKTLRLGYLSQHVDELDEDERVLESVTRLRNETRLATGRDASASNLLEEFGFTGDRLVTRIGDLSGGERRRLQFLRLLLSEPNVLLLDEPTNDLDIDTLTVIEDYLDTWPGTLIVVTHDRYFLERTCDVTHALVGDGSVPLLPGGVDQYLAGRRAEASGEGSSSTGRSEPSVAAASRAAKKELARLEGQLSKVEADIARLHDEMAAAATDYQRLAGLDEQLRDSLTRQADLEEAWLQAADT